MEHLVSSNRASSAHHGFENNESSGDASGRVSADLLIRWSTREGGGT